MHGLKWVNRPPIVAAGTGSRDAWRNGRPSLRRGAGGLLTSGSDELKVSSTDGHCDPITRTVVSADIALVVEKQLSISVLPKDDGSLGSVGFNKIDHVLAVAPGMTVIVRHDDLTGEKLRRARAPSMDNLFQIADVDSGLIR